MLYNPLQFARIRNTLLSVSVLAWILLFLDPGAGQPGAAAMHAHHHAPHAAAQPIGMRPAVNWFLMFAAMMAPVLTAEIYHVRSSSLARRRGRSTLLFVAGYTGMWLTVGAVVLVIAAALPVALPPAPLVAGTLAAALVWQCSPFKQTCLNRCHEHPPLAVFGSAADWSALRFGTRHGVWCVGSCWLWMLWPMLLPQGHLAAMALVSVLLFCERLEHPKPQKWQWRGFGRFTRLLVARTRTLVRA